MLLFITKRVYEQIQAPKKFYVFENSAHSPLFQELEKGMELMKHIIKNILTLTNVGYNIYSMLVINNWI